MTLYDFDAADVRTLLTHVADIFDGDADGQKGSALIGLTRELATVHVETIAGNDASKHGKLAAARLRTIVAAIDAQLPPVLRTPKSGKAEIF